jgi:hypothetical protein
VTDGAVVSSPAVDANGTVYFGSLDSSIYAIRDTGSDYLEIWSYQTGGEVHASPAIGGNGELLLPSFDGSLYAFLDTATPNYSVTLLPSFQTALVSEARSYTVRIQSLGGFSGTVTLSLVGAAPPGVTPAFLPASVNLTAGATTHSTLRVATTSTAPAAELRFRVRASSGSIAQESSEATLLLRDFVLVGQPTTQRVRAGHSTAFSIVPLANSDLWDFSAPISLSAVVSGPTGGTQPTLALDASTVTIPAMVSLTVGTATNTPLGTYTVEVRATAGPLTRTVQFRLEVVAP